MPLLEVGPLRTIMSSNFLGWVIAVSLPHSAPFMLEQIMPDTENRRRVLDDQQKFETFVNLMRSGAIMRSGRIGWDNDWANMVQLSATLTPFDPILAPALIVHGGADINVDISMAHKAHAGIASSELLEVESADHLVGLSHYDLVWDSIFDFLIHHAPQSGRE